jgi:hypothetical protein
MLQNWGPCYGIQCTLINLTYASTFTIIPPVKNQLGIALWTGTTGIEIAGAGASYGPTSITLINGVTSTLSFMNSNGSSLQLAPNGSGLPIFNTIAEPMTFAGAPNLWLTASTTNLSVRVSWFLNDAFNNQ